nr:glycosyl hydrolase family 8 [Aureimonas ureilytica]
MAASSLPTGAWESYRASFLDASGRIVDTGNHGISHSEGQGYGLLLAVMADDQANFDRIWSFTRTQLLVRDDGLAAWRWTPGSEPPVTDLNDASDGDILIALGLARGGAKWQRSDLTEAAATLAGSIGARLLFAHDGQTLLRPGVSGFDRGERADGPVVNLSYWVFEAFGDLAALAPGHDWSGAEAGGRHLLASVLTDAALPPEWLSLAQRPKPAAGFPSEFGYNALRLPLYLLRAREGDPDLLRKLTAGMTDANGNLRIVDLSTGATKETLNDPGYRIIPAAVACVLEGTPVPEDLRGFAPTLYYPSTLHLLALDALNERHPECLR